MLTGDLIIFGKYNWQVLGLKEDRALIITEDIIELRWYHKEFVDITWANCTLRKYLNADLYNTFSQDDKKRIITVTNKNHDNPWFSTPGGDDTIDDIF